MGGAKEEELDADGRRWTPGFALLLPGLALFRTIHLGTADLDRFTVNVALAPGKRERPELDESGQMVNLHDACLIVDQPTDEASDALISHLNIRALNHWNLWPNTLSPGDLHQGHLEEGPTPVHRSTRLFVPDAGRSDRSTGRPRKELPRKDGAPAEQAPQAEPAERSPTGRVAGVARMVLGVRGRTARRGCASGVFG